MVLVLMKKRSSSSLKLIHPRWTRGGDWPDYIKDDYRTWLKYGEFSLGSLISHGLSHDFSDDIFDYAPHGYKWKDADKLSDEQLEELFKYHPDILAGEEPWRRSADDYEGYEPETEEEIQERINQWPVKGRYDKFLNLENDWAKKEEERRKPFVEVMNKEIKKEDYPSFIDYIHAQRKYFKEHPEVEYQSPPKGYYAGQFSLGSVISHGLSHDFGELEEESHEGPFVGYEQHYNENGEPFKVEVPDYSRTKMDEFLRFTLKYTPEELKYLDRTDYQLISDTLREGGKVDREFVDNLLFKHGVHGKYDSRAEMMMSDFSEVVTNLYGVLTGSPDKEDPTFKYPTYTYGDKPDCQYHLHSDDARVKDIIVLSPYDAGSDGWKQDKDFLSGFMEVSQGVPIGKYEVVSED